MKRPDRNGGPNRTPSGLPLGAAGWLVLALADSGPRRAVWSDGHSGIEPLPDTVAGNAPGKEVAYRQPGLLARMGDRARRAARRPFRWV
jgi:hypothetical protein